MAISHAHIRDMLLPGLLEFRGSYAAVEMSWGRVFGPVPEIVLPPVSLPQAVLMGAAAVVMKNPVMRRRFWQREGNA